ncbi:hypothetical protein J1C55_13090 [Winogradskyella sp. E313]|uniref:YbjN domain-containing protein n=2 Tax=Winogradskyella immobilis TaxID=2816852 RepID=A0ABS8ER00_9FLAO|nr:hypothetical protein [Winogradskyella immobilis]
MTNAKLKAIIEESSDQIEGSNGRWQFSINQIVFVVLTDSTNNRMRIISPIAQMAAVEDKYVKAALIANFHSALDVKYAISDDILWSAFIHPLKELTDEQVKSAISQVYFANVNFGSTYASTSLVFPGKETEGEEEPKEKTPFEKRKF